MTLHTDEHEILRSNSNKLVLTNQRIQMNDKELGHAYSITIFLEDISSLQVRYKSKIVLVFIAAFFLVCSLLAMMGAGLGPGIVSLPLILGLFCLLLWWLSRKHIVSIYPDGGKPLEFSVSSISELQIENFLDKLQHAKAQRISQLHIR